MHTHRRFYATLPEFMPGHEPITRQDTSFKQLFSFVNWQGVGLVRYLYWIGMWAIGVFNSALFISGLATGKMTPIIICCVFIPIFTVAEVIVLRILCEIAVVLLLMPYYFTPISSGKGHSNVTVIEDPNDDADLDISIHSNA